MSRWLALGEPVVRVTVRLPRLKSKDERLRERAAAYVEASFARHYGEKDAWRWEQHKRVRVAIRINERAAVLEAMRTRVPWWRWRLRREVQRQLLRKHDIPKWW